jgi:hypothetical protein
MRSALFLLVLLFSSFVPSEAGATGKSLTEKDTSSRLGSGFTLTAIGGANWALTGKPYTIISEDAFYNRTYTKYDLKSAIGYRAGLGIGFQGRKYGLEFPLIISVDRFKVPAISEKDKMKISSFEFGFNNYIKFGKEKHYILLGPYAQLEMQNFLIETFGVDLGYGFNITKRLNTSLRYKLNVTSFFNKSAIEVYTMEGQSGFSGRYGEGYSVIELVARFDLVNTRRIKKYIPPPPPPRIPMNCTAYSDLELIKLRKEAKAKNDMDTYGDIQREMDLRNSRNPYGKYDDAQLKEMLGKAVASEDYPEAERLQKEIKRREPLKAAEAQ